MPPSHQGVTRKSCRAPNSPDDPHTCLLCGSLIRKGAIASPQRMSQRRTNAAQNPRSLCQSVLEYDTGGAYA